MATLTDLADGLPLWLGSGGEAARVSGRRLRAGGAHEKLSRAMTAFRDGHALGAQAERLGASGEPWPSGGLQRGRPVLVVVAAYAAVGAVAIGASLALGRNPIACDAWIGARGAASWVLSVGLGLLLGATTIAATRIMVRRTGWARELYFALRPAVQGESGAMLLVVAVASGTGEELFFRGLLVPFVGVIASSIFFGALHQIRGRARWGWMAWATLMGLLFASVFAATGSLAGPLIAHAAINHANLRFLRDNHAAPRRRPLGGLLRR
jgi:membrane protease YdiL (CAAX protease family)